MQVPWLGARLCSCRALIFARPFSGRIIFCTIDHRQTASQQKRKRVSVSATNEHGNRNVFPFHQTNCHLFVFIYTCCAWAGGTESRFVVIQLCCCVIFWFWREIGFGFTYLRTQSTIQLWRCVSFLVLAGNSLWCYVRTQCTIHLCNCVSFWLWREIVLKMRIPFEFLLGYFIMIRW